MRNVAALEELEARNSPRIERYNLTVENHGSISELTHRGSDTPKCCRPIEVVP